MISLISSTTLPSRLSKGHPAAQGLSEEESLENRMEEKSREFAEKEAEGCVPA